MFVCRGPPPHVLEVTGDLDKEDRRVGGRGKTLGRGLRDGAAGSTSDRARRRFFAPQGSRGLDVVLACVEEGAILVEGVVLVACLSSRVGVATCSHMNVPLTASCRYEAVPNVLRNVLV
jgi:hypothetical protein